MNRRPFGLRDLLLHDEDDGCLKHCRSCRLCHTGYAFEWCEGCGHAFRTVDELVREYRASLARKAAVFQWLSAVVANKWKLNKRITGCPLCGHSFGGAE